MTLFQLKVWACLFMFIDHAGVALFDDNLALRAIGRLSMPIFAFLLVEGFRRTADVKAYLLRLTGFALISQPVYLYAFAGYPGLGLNIMFTLLLGLIMLYFYQRNPRDWIVVASAIVAELTELSYGSFAMLLIIVLYRWDGRSRGQLMRHMLLPIGWQAFLRMILALGTYGLVAPNIYLQLLPTILLGSLAWFAVFFIGAYNHQSGPQAKYLFYLFYPGHMLVLACMKQLPEWLRLILG